MAVLLVVRLVGDDLSADGAEKYLRFGNMADLDLETSAPFESSSSFPGLELRSMTRRASPLIDMLKRSVRTDEPRGVCMADIGRFLVGEGSVLTLDSGGLAALILDPQNSSSASSPSESE